MADVLSNLQPVLRASLHSKISLEIDTPTDLWPITVDPGELELALLNLVVNARDAIAESGAVRISATNQVLQGEPQGLSGEFVALAVSDNGAGISPHILDRVFEPFFTTKEVGKGTGLGLSQVYGFARQSGGLATVASSPGRGTSVTLYLPKSKGAVQSLVVSEPAPSPAGRENLCVLLVEDNDEVAAGADRGICLRLVRVQLIDPPAAQGCDELGA